MKPKILSYGEIIFDLVQGRPFLGGAPLNFAWFINQLGGEATLFSSVGKDAMGSEAVSRIEEYGINNHINISNQPTGTAIVNPEGKFEISYPAAWSEVAAPKSVDGLYDLLYFGTLAQTSPFNSSQIVDLVENAVKYSGNNGEVLVKLGKSKGAISLTIEDKGVGLAMDESTRIFDKFYRAENEDTRKTKGTGLGLFIVKYIVENHKGQISVRNNMPSGCIFEVCF